MVWCGRIKSFVLCLKLFADLSCGEVNSQSKDKLGNVCVMAYVYSITEETQ